MYVNPRWEEGYCQGDEGPEEGVCDLIISYQLDRGLGRDRGKAYSSQNDSVDTPRAIVGDTLVVCERPGQGDEARGGGEEGYGAEGEDGGMFL
jgi:hypothetical protein